MRACWIDTSSMFRTIRGFFETVALTSLPRRHQPVTAEQALAWGRREAISVVPEQASAK